MRHFILFASLLACSATAARTQSPDRQLWLDVVPSWRLDTHATDELEFSVRTAWDGAAPTQYWATNTLERSATPWLGLTAVGTLVESRGPVHGDGYFEMRLSTGARLTWRGERVRTSEYLRAEHRMLRPLNAAAFTIERLRHREQILIALNHPSLDRPGTTFLITDAEWFLVHDGHGGWASNQLRARAGLGYRWNAHRSIEVLLNDTQRRGGLAPTFEDGDHILRVRWREAF